MTIQSDDGSWADATEPNSNAGNASNAIPQLDDVFAHRNKAAGTETWSASSEISEFAVDDELAFAEDTDEHSRVDTTTKDPEQQHTEPETSQTVVFTGDDSAKKPASEKRRKVRSENEISRRRLRGTKQRFEARKVYRLIRHIDPWSLAKFTLVFMFSLWVTMMVAAFVIWMIAERAGTVTDIEDFVVGLGIDSFTLDGTFFIRQLGLIGLIGVFGFTAASIVASMVFNLISDIIGGIWITVIEEETARKVSSSTDE